jgi:hypothetical protein
MTNKLFVISTSILLAGCNVVGDAFTYTEAAKFIKGYAIGFPEDAVSEEKLNSINASVANIKIGRGSSSLVVLAYVRNGSHEWVSNDGVKVFTRNGQVFKTMGLASDVTYQPINYQDVSLHGTSFITTASFYQPDLFITSVENIIVKEDRETFLVKEGQEIETTLYKHNFYIPLIKWGGVNKYFVDKNGLIIRSEQELHPKLPAFRIDFFYKF